MEQLALKLAEQLPMVIILLLILKWFMDQMEVLLTDHRDDLDELIAAVKKLADELSKR